MSAHDRIAKNEAWVRELESRLERYERRLPVYRRAYIALAVGGLTCFVFGPMVGLWGSLCAPFVSLCGWGMLNVRLSELSAEIHALRVESARLRPAHADHGVAATAIGSNPPTD
jgi:hypothetical protein